MAPQTVAFTTASGPPPAPPRERMLHFYDGEHYIRSLSAHFIEAVYGEGAALKRKRILDDLAAYGTKQMRYAGEHAIHLEDLEP
jgi:hypothetical protein